MLSLIRELYPICRSITGDGVRQTLKILEKHIPLELTEVPTGTPVLDWTVPKEWNIRGGWIRSTSGETIIDFAQCNLHVLNYSTPVSQRITRTELDPHLYSIPDQPDWVPYRTSYYTERWGFCLSEKQRQRLTEAEYDIFIDSTLDDGHLTFAECVLPGKTTDEILLTAHICHPSLCNDNLSGIAVATFLAKALQQSRLRHTVRLLFIPGTIGSITWLALNRQHIDHVRHGLSLVCLGDSSPFTYKRTLCGKTELDHVMSHVLKTSGEPHQIIDYFPYGYDERQFNSPGFALAFGSLMRGQHGQFPEYHTSADNLDFVKSDKLEASLALCERMVEVLDQNRRYKNLSPYGEPQLGNRGVYRSLGGIDIADTQLAIFWVLALGTGEHSLLSIAERAKLPFKIIVEAAQILEKHDLLAAQDESSEL